MLIMFNWCNKNVEIIRELGI